MKKLMLCRLVVGTVCAFGIVSAAEAAIGATLLEAQQETEGKRAQKQELDDLQRRFREGQEARRRRRMGLPSASAAESAQKPTVAPIADERPPRIYSEAEQAEAKRQFMLGWQYEQEMGEDGANVLMLNGKAQEHYRRAAEYGYLEAYYRMAGLELQAQREHNAIDYWLKATELGHERSFEALHSFLQKSPINFQRAKVKKAYVMMARKGNQHAREMLDKESIPWDAGVDRQWKGEMKAEQDMERKVARAKEDAEAKTRVEVMLDKAEKGDVWEQVKVFTAYDVGKDGVTQDKAEAFKWLRKLVENGLAPSVLGDGISLFQEQLASRLEKGIGTERNPAEAVKWYTAAAKRGYPPAQNALRAKGLTW